MQRDWMTCNLHVSIPQGAASPAVLRAIVPSDAEPLALLMLAAYRGTVDDEGETIDGAREEVRKLLAGEFGAFDAEHSTLWYSNGDLVAATILTRTRGAQPEPFLAFSLTAPHAQRQGLARAGLTRAMQQLRTQGHSRLHLVVTRANARAVNLYRSCGFVVAPKPG
jgi:ribosomal protein S18 acetylase RimI-like enzyme